MSSFLSNRFLEYRKGLAGPPKPIETDLFCTGCGYNVRGLMYGRNCPECGTQIRKNMGLADVLLDGDVPQRHNMKLGLTLLATVLIAKAFERLASFIWIVFFPSSAKVIVFASVDVALSAAWAAGAWLTLPQRLDSHYYPWRAVRITARCSQVLWPVSALCWLLAVTRFTNSSAGDSLLSVSMWVSIVGFIGAIGLVFVLHRLATDAELEVAARRMNLAVWMLPIPSILLATLPDQMAWIGMFFVIALVLIWCWYVLLLGFAVLVMQRHVSWSLRIAEDAPLRHTRIEQTRSEIDADVRTQIRPSSDALKDVPLAEKRGQTPSSH